MGSTGRKVLVVGSGGREHTIVWALNKSPLVGSLIAAPGNAGIAQIATCHDIAANDLDGQVSLAKREEVSFVVVGPEDPLAAGLVDRLTNVGIRAFGPAAAAARIESSKVFSKKFMGEQNIPTAAFEVFTDLGEAVQYIRDCPHRVVVKASGLAAGKGAILPKNNDAAVAAVEKIMGDRVFGDAGSSVVIEELMEGEEASVLGLCDGKTVVALPPSQDHKRAYDHDQGTNTGGMGAYAPAPVVTPELMEEILERVMRPAVEGMARLGTPYKGVLFAGIMFTADGIKVVEFNCRFGDPEVQVTLPLLKTDLMVLMDACVDGTLDQIELDYHDGAAVIVVMASPGYPHDYPKGLPIHGVEKAQEIKGVTLFHAGTATEKGRLVTSGGRVLGVTAVADNIGAAIHAAYSGVDKIWFEGQQAHFRHDIGHRAIGRS